LHKGKLPTEFPLFCNVGWVEHGETQQNQFASQVAILARPLNDLADIRFIVFSSRHRLPVDRLSHLPALSVLGFAALYPTYVCCHYPLYPAVCNGCRTSRLCCVGFRCALPNLRLLPISVVSCRMQWLPHPPACLSCHVTM